MPVVDDDLFGGLSEFPAEGFARDEGEFSGGDDFGGEGGGFFLLTEIDDDGPVLGLLFEGGFEGGKVVGEGGEDQGEGGEKSYFHGIGSAIFYFSQTEKSIFWEDRSSCGCAKDDSKRICVIDGGGGFVAGIRAVKP